MIHDPVVQAKSDYASKMAATNGIRYLIVKGGEAQQKITELMRERLGYHLLIEA